MECGIWLLISMALTFCLFYRPALALLWARIQARLAPDCVEETFMIHKYLYFISNVPYTNDWCTSDICHPTHQAIRIGGITLSAWLHFASPLATWEHRMDCKNFHGCPRPQKY